MQAMKIEVFKQSIISRGEILREIGFSPEEWNAAD